MSSTRDALCMCDLCRKRAAAYSRTEAFGAIRRAAREAREWDLVMASVQTLEPSIIGDAIRRSIRIAIGSDKR